MIILRNNVSVPSPWNGKQYSTHNFPWVDREEGKRASFALKLDVWQTLEEELGLGFGKMTYLDMADGIVCCISD